jgi:hypothetical protein
MFLFFFYFFEKTQDVSTSPGNETAGTIQEEKIVKLGEIDNKVTQTENCFL